MGLPFKYVFSSFKKKGFYRVFGQILLRFYYNVLNLKKDNSILERIFCEKQINRSINQWSGDKHITESFFHPKTKNWFKDIKPDIIIVHCGAIIPKYILNASKDNIVIGGHPGLTPKYRGSHSIFWAIYNQSINDIMCSVFFLTNKIDGGDIIAQKKFL